MAGAREFIDLEGSRLEYRLTKAEPSASDLPPLVFLHEGLGSVSHWRQFPDHVRDALGGPAMLVYSRAGHGWSYGGVAPRPPSFMSDEAASVLPRVLDDLRVRRPLLVGHSDGASIALLHAAYGHDIAGVVAIAPHVFVEDLTIAGIEAVSSSLPGGDLLRRLARHHERPASTFRAWADTWLHPDFRAWDITGVLNEVKVPVLVVQGTDDEYGTMAHVREIAAAVNGPFESLVLNGVGHAPHVENPEKTVAAIRDFVETFLVPNRR